MEVNFSIPFLFRNSSPIRVGSHIKILGIRYSYLEQCYEIKEIDDESSGITYKSENYMKLYEMSWQNIEFAAIVRKTEITDGKTKFHLSGLDEL